MPVAASTSCSAALAGVRIIAGPARIIGRWAVCSTPPMRRPSFSSSIGKSGHGDSPSARGACASSTSLGRLTTTGPGRPCDAKASARRTSPPSEPASSAVHAAFASGCASCAWGISWKAPRPSSARALWPLSTTSGDSACRATNSAESPLACPGPAVSSATPGWPVSRPQASAMCTAAASCRTWMISSPASRHASYTERIWLPDSENRRSTPDSISAATR